MGGRHWDDTDPDAPRAGLQDSLVDQTGDVHAVGEDKRVTLPGTISGGISPEEAVTWLRGHREDVGHPLSRFREQITNVNRCTDVQTRLQALPSPRPAAGLLRSGDDCERPAGFWYGTDRSAETVPSWRWEAIP